MIIRKLQNKDREKIEKILFEVDAFNKNEINVALELIDIYLRNPAQKDYDLYTAVDGVNDVAGYICIGPTPLTKGTYDLYWIAVKPSIQGKGIGKKLLKYAENIVRKKNGRLIIIETSSQKKYLKTRIFYESAGYKVLAQIKGYYKKGDDLIIYGKYL